MMVVFVLKMHEVWANAPSLEHKSMGLKKTLVDHFFENNDAGDDFLKTSVLDLLKCLSLIKKNLFDCQTILKNYTRT